MPRRTRRVMVAATSLSVGLFLALSAISSASVNWSTVTSEAAGGGQAALVKAAKAEKTLNVIALPSNWANYGKEITTFESLYKIHVVSEDPSDSSAQEIAAIKTSRGRSSAPDVVDVGGAFASAGASEGLFAPYKVGTWANIPANQKVPSALYYQDYGGFISFGCNLKLLGSTPCPTTWSALEGAQYKGDVDLNGSPTSANAALSAVGARAIKNGR